MSKSTYYIQVISANTVNKNGTLYTEESLKNQMEDYVGMDIRESSDSDKVVGKVISVKWNEEDKCIDAQMELNDDYAKKIDEASQVDQFLNMWPEDQQEELMKTSEFKEILDDTPHSCNCSCCPSKDQCLIGVNDLDKGEI